MHVCVQVCIYIYNYIYIIIYIIIYICAQLCTYIFLWFSRIASRCCFTAIWNSDPLPYQPFPSVFRGDARCWWCEPGNRTYTLSSIQNLIRHALVCWSIMSFHELSMMFIDFQRTRQVLEISLHSPVSTVSLVWPSLTAKPRWRWETQNWSNGMAGVKWVCLKMLGIFPMK